MLSIIKNVVLYYSRSALYQVLGALRPVLGFNT